MAGTFIKSVLTVPNRQLFGTQIRAVMSPRSMNVVIALSCGLRSCGFVNVRTDSE